MKTLSHLEQQVGGALVEAISHLDAESKRLSSGILISRVSEHTFQKDKSFLLIHINFRSSKLLLTPIYKKLVTELEKKLKKTVLLLSSRKINSRWIKENRTQTRPNSRTLTAVYSAILDELLLPGVIIGQRTRVRLDGSSFSKIVIDKSEQHFLEDRVEAIKVAYKHLTHRDIEIEFQKEATYYTLKKGERK
jgi:small subunit ribosomal protein S7e